MAPETKIGVLILTNVVRVGEQEPSFNLTTSPIFFTEPLASSPFAPIANMKLIDGVAVVLHKKLRVVKRSCYTCGRMGRIHSVAFCKSGISEVLQWDATANAVYGGGNELFFGAHSYYYAGSEEDPGKVKKGKASLRMATISII